MATAAVELISLEEILQLHDDPFEDPVGAIELAVSLANERASKPASRPPDIGPALLDEARETLAMPDVQAAGALFRMLVDEVRRLGALVKVVGKQGGATEHDLIATEIREDQAARALAKVEKERAALEKRVGELTAAHQGAADAAEAFRKVADIERAKASEARQRLEAKEEELKHAEALLTSEGDEELVRLREDNRARHEQLTELGVKCNAVKQELASARDRIRALEAQVSGRPVDPAERAALEEAVAEARRRFRYLKETVPGLVPAVRELRDAAIGERLATQVPHLIALGGQLEKLAGEMGWEP